MALFRARARTLDMLGRQQIAGIPTAISELFKNAHDAYADSVEVDFYRSDGLFVLRDDGLGMTREDFESRWLTLGTESKLDANTALGLPPVNANKPKRPILGEKGIGRLAIGAIGPQVLVLTRALRDGILSDLTAAFIHWGIFQCPGIDLDQVEIPLITVPGGSLPSKSDIDGMVKQVRGNLDTLKTRLVPATYTNLIKDLGRFSVDPQAMNASFGKPSLSKDGSGTHFYVMPADSSLVAAIDERADEDSAPPLTKLLLGFTNTMTPNHPPPQIQTAFRDHRSDDASEELIGEQGFFTPDEFRNADHHIQGRFDEYGQFLGSVTVYGEESKSHVVAWDAARGKKTECGPFVINVGYVQGKSNESTLPQNDWVQIIRKLNQIGGLYIYKDNIRVLPYGNNDYDFLDIEKNRTKSASYYYFSFRRMLGVIEISQKKNPQLNEKAGREGFRENLAYRQFRAILMNFFIQIAADFFREGSAGAERYVERKAEIDRNEQARRNREKQLTARRAAFGHQLEAFFEEVGKGKHREDVAALIESVNTQLLAATKMKDREQASRTVIDIEASALRSLDDLRKHYRVARPNGVGLSKQLRRDWDAAVLETRKLEQDVFAPANNELARLVSDEASKAKIDVSLRLRLERALGDQILDTQRRTTSERKEARVALEGVNAQVASVTREIAQEVDSAIGEVRSELARMDLSAMEAEQIIARRHALESQLEDVAQRNLSALGTIKDDLRSLHWSRDDEGRFVGMSLMNESIQEELLEVRERSEADLELTQLGMAINVVNHEFENSIKSVRNGLRRLKSWGDVNEALLPLYNDLRSAFDHLDGYLSLFTPLQRRLYRSEIEISGAEIAKFLTDLFGPRLLRHDIELQPSTSFLRYKLASYPSSLYPVFVNLVDNAIYWIKDQPKPRFIKLNSKDEAMMIQDSGPGVQEGDREAIFELGFTRKPGGRGLGLHISREALAKIGYELMLGPASRSVGAEFIIRPLEKKRGDDLDA
jgi:signal transduction histidine kinase